MSGTVRNLLGGTLTYGLGEVISRLTTLLLLPVFTAYLSPQDYGAISILSGLTIFLTPICSLGIGAAIAPVYFDGDDRHRKEAIIAVASTLLAASSAILLTLGAAASGLISMLLFGTEEFRRLVNISLVTTALSVLVIPFRQYLQFENRARSYVVRSTLTIAATTLLSVLLVIGARRGVDGMLEASLGGQAVGLALFVGPAVPFLRFRVDVALRHDLLRVSLPLVPAFGCLFLLQHGSKYMLQWLAGLDAVGLYTVGFNVGLVVSLIVTAFQNAWIPYFMTQSTRPDAGALFGRVLTYYVLAVGSITLAVFAVARPLILVMTKPPFHPAWQVVGLSATAQFLAGVYTVLLATMYVAKEAQYSGFIQGAAAAVGVLANLLLIPSMGMRGAAAALVISYASLAVFQHLWSVRRGYLAVGYERSRLVRAAILFACYALVAAWGRDWPLWLEIMLSAALLCVLPLGVYAQLTETERHMLRQMAFDLLRRKSEPMAAASPQVPIEHRID